MRAFEYTPAADLRSALRSIGSDARPYAGGTDVLPLLHARVDQPNRLVDIKRAGLPEGVQERDGHVRIGALTSVSELESSAVIERRFPLLQQAARSIATPQLRNRATLGGNLLQRPRCWYFRSEIVRCWLKGGGDCPAASGRNELHAIFGEGPCRAVHPSDLAPCLYALDARARVAGTYGSRTLTMDELFALPEPHQRKETRLEPDELIVEVELPMEPESTRSAYAKAMDRKVWAFALASVAIVLRMRGRRIGSARIVLGGVAPIPWRAEAAERALLEAELGPDLGTDAAREAIERVTRAALDGASPLSHNAYKQTLVQRLLRSTLLELISRAD